MRKTIAALTAGAVIVGGAAVATAQTDETTTDEPRVEWAETRRGEHITEFLSDMVSEDVISQEQADQMLAALEERREAHIAERQERRAAMETAWEDGVLTLDEIEELGLDRLLDEDGPFAEALEDDQITQEEFDAVKAELPRPHRGHRGPGFGSGGPGNGEA